jgi:hypothetical protein
MFSPVHVICGEGRAFRLSDKSDYVLPMITENAARLFWQK